MAKQFTFNEYLKNSESVAKFVTSLLHYSSSQSIIQARFLHLLRNAEALSEQAKKEDVARRKAYLSPADLQAVSSTRAAASSSCRSRADSLRSRPVGS